MAEWYRLKKGSKYYTTQSSFLRDVCIQFKGYSKHGADVYFWKSGHLLPFKLTKDDRDKYKVLLRLTK